MNRLLYLLFEIKRSFRKMGYLILTVLLLACICVGIVSAVSHSSDSEPATAPFTVVVAIPENSGIHYNLALGMVSQMDSFRSMCTVISTDSEEKAMAMLESGEARAAVLIPEGLIHSVLNGGNLPARIIYPTEPSLETVLFRNLVDSLARMLAAAQSGVYALYDIYSRFDASEEIQAQANSALNSEYIGLVLGRRSLFVREDVSADSVSSPIYHFLSGGLALLFLLGGICLCDCLCPSPSVLSQALGRIRIGRILTCFAPAFGAFITQYLLYCLIFLCAYYVPFLREILPERSLNFLPTLAVCIFFAASFQLFICRIFRFREAAVIGLFFVSFIAVFAAGGLLPSAFLPSALRQAARFNPVFYLQKTLANGLCGTVSLSSVTVLLACGFAFIMLPAGIEILAAHQKRSVPARSDLMMTRQPARISFASAYQTTLSRNSARRVSFSGLKHICAWFRFLGQRTLCRPVYWILSALMLLAGAASHLTTIEESSSIPVGIYCENPDSFTSAVMSSPLNQPADRLYHFYSADSAEMLKEDILWGRAECGYIIPDSLFSLLEEEKDGIICALTGPSSVLTELVHEEIYAAIFEAWAPSILADYMEHAQDISLSEAEFSAAADEYYLDWLLHGNTFYVEYEDVDDAFFSNKSAFALPLRGILSLLLFCTVMAGTAQYRHDKRQQRFLVRRASEHICLPVFCSLLPSLLPAVSGLICLYINGQLEPVLYELAALSFYLTALTAFAATASHLIRSTLLFDALIPILIIFCVLYAPVITDLSTFLPAGEILSKLAPANWYLYFF